MELTDEQLVEKIQSGDTGLFSVLVGRYEEKMKRYARKFVRNSQDIDDEVQDVFMKIYVNIHSFDPSRKFSSWLYRIAHNTFLNHIRSSKKDIFRIDFDTVLPFLYSSESPEKLYALKEIEREVRTHMDGLDQKYRDILILRFQEGLSYEEIADILRIPVSTVGVRISRALKKIKENYGKKQ